MRPSSDCVALRRKTPTPCSLNAAPAKKSAEESSVDQHPQTTEKASFSVTEPIPARFGRKETKAVQRPKISVPPVSEVRSDRLNAFETQRNFCADAALLRVRNKIMAERVGFEPTIESPLYTLSRRAPSTARPSLLGAGRYRRQPGMARGREDAKGRLGKTSERS